MVLGVGSQGRLRQPVRLGKSGGPVGAREVRETGGGSGWSWEVLGGVPGGQEGVVRGGPGWHPEVLGGVPGGPGGHQIRGVNS